MMRVVFTYKRIYAKGGSEFERYSLMVNVSSTTLAISHMNKMSTSFQTSAENENTEDENRTN